MTTITFCQKLATKVSVGVGYIIFAIVVQSTAWSGDLKQMQATDWLSIDDRVMGGVSQSDMSKVGDTLVFSGRVSLENNGGFASVRSLLDLRSVDESAFVQLTVKGDGHQYQLRFRTSNDFDGVSYAVVFDTVEDKEIQLRFTPDQFTPVWRGRVVANAPEFSWQDVRQIGFMISGKQQGEFWLQVNQIDWFSQA